MMTAAGKAEIYAGAMRIYLDNPVPGWRFIHRYRLRRGFRHVTRLYRMHDEEVTRCAELIDAWCAVYDRTSGPSRGPTQTPLHIPEQGLKAPHLGV